MAAETYTIDAVSIDATNTALLLTDTANGIEVVDISFPDPDEHPIYATSADTEGDPLVQNQLGNRTIPAVVRCFGSSNGRARVKDLQHKAGKVKRDATLSGAGVGGTLKRTMTNGDVIYFDLCNMQVTVPVDFYTAVRDSYMCPVTFTTKPLGYGDEVTLTDHVETTLPCVVGTDTGVKGDWPGLGRLVIDNDSSSDQYQVWWGIESRTYPGTATAATTAALFYEAESRLLYGGAALRALSGASGGTVVQGTATTSYQAVCSTISSGTAYCSHVGDYNVWARVYDHGGSVSSSGTTPGVTWALEWSQGDFLKVTRNDPIPTPVASAFSMVDLGQVHLDKASQGAQRWEGRVLAQGSDASAAYSVDCLYLQPVSEGAGIAKTTVQAITPTAFNARDEFAQSAGNLNAKTAPAGGNWTTSGAATDLAVEATGHTVTRSTNVTGTRYAISGASAQTNQVVQLDVKETTTGGLLTAIARWTDSSNYLRVDVGNGDAVVVNKVVASAATPLGSVTTASVGSFLQGIWYTLRMYADAGGHWGVWFAPRGATLSTPLLVGQDSDLATGGTLASGKAGFADDLATAGLTITRSYDNFWAATPIADATIFASQSLEVRYDGVIREDSTGTVWGNPTYEGDHFQVPVAGAEARSLRVISKQSRNDTTTGADPGIDDQSHRITYRPRWFSVPES